MLTTRLSSLIAYCVLLLLGTVAMGGPEDVRSSPRQSLRPGDDVEWINYPPQNDKGNESWGYFLTDIARHLPETYGERYSSEDRITHAHETTHGINSHLSNHLGQGLGSGYGFYVGQDRAVLLSEPNVKLSQISPFIPQSLRGTRYQLYLLDQQKYFEDHPLYLFDEWVAYTNGGQAGVELAERNQLDMARNDALVGPMEFSIYALALAAAIQHYDPVYLRENKQFREFLAHELRRATSVYRRGMNLEQFSWDRSLERNLLHHDDAGALRDIVRKLYGDRLSLEALLRG